ncbi:MAG: T9SS type A sorting domain-containing protein [Bacteroidetes bacterium]|nr:T9SS type A sorting domain-containing protein [Bacteroidota bacterium]
MKTNHFLVSLIALSSFLVPQGKVYLVLGSDTAIWDGMSTSRYNCTYNIQLFTDVNKNPYKVMEPSFRNRFTDSFGTPVKLTWWMMAGNIFRFATNNNVPVPNTMTLWLMKKYYGQSIARWGDELTLHYHTFGWTDYDNDGVFWWNQTEQFAELRDDFDVTLAQYLLEENTFPVSFRSGWHYMDNGWQNYLNTLLPYSLHNDYPAKRTDLTEPRDNNYDWSLSSPEFVPFHPSPQNYQLAGTGKGWNVRSEYMGSVSTTMMNNIFSKANQGTDQLACFWSHLPEGTFLDEIAHVDSLAHKAALLYPNVKFQYCTAVEAYQLWRKGTDTIKPELALSEEVSGIQRKFVISTNEPIFQSQPFVAIKDIYYRYTVADCIQTAPGTWKTVNSFFVDDLMKVGTAITDTMGNLSTAFIRYKPDDMFVDNLDQGYSELAGSWSNSAAAAWGINSRVATIQPGDSAKVRWNFIPSQSTWHSLHLQFPEVANRLDLLDLQIFKNGFPVENFSWQNNSPGNKWAYLTSKEFESGSLYSFIVTGRNMTSTPKIMSADVIRISANVRNRYLVCEKTFLNLGEVNEMDTLVFDVPVRNEGINDLTLFSVLSVTGKIKPTVSYPQSVPGMSPYRIGLQFIPSQRGVHTDTVIIISNDPVNGFLKIPVTLTVMPYFEIVDDNDSLNYSESGAWYKSVAQAYGTSSRYAYINTTTPPPVATFSCVIQKTGLFDVSFIVPVTTNSANNALYIIKRDGIAIDSFHVNQNSNSGYWRTLGRYQFAAGDNISVSVVDSRESTTGPVIRADAVKISTADPTGTGEGKNPLIPEKTTLYQNFPNPFNPVTTFRFNLAEPGYIRLAVYNAVGELVATPLQQFMQQGAHSYIFDASGLTSGIYLYRLETGNEKLSGKMIILR